MKRTMLSIADQGLCINHTRTALQSAINHFGVLNTTHLVLNSTWSNWRTWTSVKREPRASSRDRRGVQACNRCTSHTRKSRGQAGDGVGQGRQNAWCSSIEHGPHGVSRTEAAWVGGSGRLCESSVGEERWVEREEGVHGTLVAAKVEDLGLGLGEVEDVTEDCEK